MASTSYSSLPVSKQWDYDVFLSFRGEDTRKTFAGHLYSALCLAGINTFKDDKTMKQGASISPQLISAIEGSMFAIIIFSKNYASSKWCLDELVKIMECKSKLGQEVIPVFYDISPSEVRSQRTSFAEAFSRYEEAFRGDTKKVHNWRKALTEAANLSGHDLHGSTHNGDEAQCIEHIVKEIGNELCRKSTVSVTLIGAESQIEAVSSLLMMGCEDVRFLGISGMGGIGKTTLASAIFHRFSCQFEGACFVANIKETQAKEGLLFLQKTLLTKLLSIESLNLADENGGIYMIKKRLGFKKVLVVLDDVDHKDQLNGLAGAHGWFGKGSRIIITARDEHLLKKCDDTYKVPLLATAEATQLFSWHAFGKTYPDTGFEQFSHQVVLYAGCLPLALKVLGSFFNGRNMQEWRSGLDELRRIPRNEIISKLKISYDVLEDAIKQVFLDLACVFGSSAAFLLKKVFSEIVINVLIEKSLLFVSSAGMIEMHDLIREMGQQIAEQESPRRRIWLHKDVDILTENKGGEAIEGIAIPPKSNSEEDTIHLSSDVFKHMKRLRVFQSWSHDSYMSFRNPINFLPNSLYWLWWSYYPSPSLPKEFDPPNLVMLTMLYSSVVDLWKGSKRLNRLTLLEMTGSQNLIRIPDLSGSPNLERLFLCCCIRLKEIHPSVGSLNKLTILDAEGCVKLERLPTIFQSRSLAILNFSGCRSLRKCPEIQPYYGELEVTSSLPTHQNFLDLSGCSNIETLPNSICRLKNLKYIYLNRCTKLKNLPEDICDLVNLEAIDASETSIWCIPNSVTCLEKLKLLSFRKVPKSFHPSETSICRIPNLMTCLEKPKFLSFRKVHKFFHVSDLCSRGCFAQLDLNFHLPNVLSAICPLTNLDLSACNLCDGSIPEDLGCIASLTELILSRNSFTYLPKSIALLYRLQLLDVTYCEKLKELPELPPGIMKLFADDRFALQFIPTLSAMYKELYLVSFANQKLQEMWCNSRRESSSVQMRNCPGINMTNMLEDILLPFLSMVQRKLVFDDPRRRGRFIIVFPRCDSSVEVRRWFNYRTKTCSKEISLNLDKHWYDDKFLGFALYCQLSFLTDELRKLSQREFTFCSSWAIKITTKLVPAPNFINRPAIAEVVYLELSNVVTCASHDCFVFLPLDPRKGKDASMVDDPNIYCRFEASIDWDVSSNWGVSLVYADDIEEMMLTSCKFNNLEHLREKED